jgi:hypothetical protein
VCTARGRGKGARFKGTVSQSNLSLKKVTAYVL